MHLTTPAISIGNIRTSHHNEPKRDENAHIRWKDQVPSDKNERTCDGNLHVSSGLDTGWVSCSSAHECI